MSICERDKGSQVQLYFRFRHLHICTYVQKYCIHKEINIFKNGNITKKRNKRSGISCLKKKENLYRIKNKNKNKNEILRITKRKRKFSYNVV